MHDDDRCDGFKRGWEGYIAVGRGGRFVVGIIGASGGRWWDMERGWCLRFVWAKCFELFCFLFRGIQRAGLVVMYIY